MSKESEFLSQAELAAIEKAGAGKVEYSVLESAPADLRLSALHLAQDFHSKSGAFEAITPGAPEVVKTAENFFNFLSGSDYNSEVPERADRRAPVQNSGDVTKSEIITLD